MDSPIHRARRKRHRLFSTARGNFIENANQRDAKRPVHTLRHAALNRAALLLQKHAVARYSMRAGLPY